MADAADTFSGEIKVASRIVDHLSSGIYKSPAACLKELINNSYDADATSVTVSVKPDADRIIIQDDGVGFSKAEFITHFDRVAHSTKRASSDRTSSGRPKIGHIGIGFIAANEICDQLEIFSTQPGSPELLHVTIDFALMRGSIADRDRGHGDVAKGDYVGETLPANVQEHYTTLVLKRIRGPARDILAGATARRKDGSLYGKSPATIAEFLATNDLRSWSDLDEYSHTMLRVALNVPVRYAPDWAPQDLLSQGLNDFTQMTDRLGFTVTYDGTDLRKPIIFHPGSRRVLVRAFEHNGDLAAAKGYFYAQHGKVEPADLQGLLVRIRHSAVGEYDRTYWGFPASEGPVLKTWVSAEIWPDDTLEAAMNIDRSTLRDVHPAYVELRDALHAFFTDFLKEVRSELYGAGAAKRRTERASNELTKIQRVVQTHLTSSPDAARSVSRAWAEEAGAAERPEALIKQYSVSALYAIVIDTAQSVLPEALLKRFVEQLTKRLRQ